MTKPVILTGIRANEELTIGNYLGAMVPMVQLQRQFAGEYQLNMFVPDLHSFTTPVNHDELRGNIIRNLKYFMAAGLDIHQPDTYIYRQSYISAHSELTWILDCFTYVGEMQRMNEFKDKSAKEVSVSMGLMNYPVLMAADILLYGARHVPVGKDQFQHLEITRDIAMRMNNKFDQALFVVPDSTEEQMKFIHRDTGLKIRSLTNPLKKMSKSSDDDDSKINLGDDPALARKKIMSAMTDSVGIIHFDWENQPGITSLLQILAMLTDTPQEQIITQWQGRTRYGELKTAVADAVEQFLTDYQTKLAAIDDDDLYARLEECEAAMREVANATLLRVQQAVGLRR